MLNVAQFREYIVQPTLIRLGLHSLSAEQLLIGTALTESGLKFLHQVGGGPAQGVYQMEPDTEQDIWDNYLVYRNSLAKRISGIMSGMPNNLIGNLYYATAMCRIHYLRVKEKLPDADNIEDMANYWKKHYNTPEGKGEIIDFTEKAKLIFN